jgi:hypothetical protein
MDARAPGQMIEARHRKPLGLPPSRATPAWWRTFRGGISVLIAGSATVLGVSLGLSGPVVSPVTPAAVDAAGTTAEGAAALAPVAGEVAASNPAEGDPGDDGGRNGGRTSAAGERGDWNRGGPGR